MFSDVKPILAVKYPEEHLMRLPIELSFVLLAVNSFSQSTDTCTLNQRQINFRISAAITEIKNAEYNSLREVYYKPVSVTWPGVHSDSLEETVVKKYPAVFASADSCYTFKTNRGEEINACGKNGSNMKEWSSYRFVDTQCDLIRIEMEYYEGWGNLYVNPNTGVAFYTLGKPNFAGCNYLYSIDSYYGEAEISIIDLKNNREIVLMYDNWRVEEVFSVQTHFLFKLKTTSCNGAVKYLSVYITE